MDTRVRTTLQTKKSSAKQDNKVAKSPYPLKKVKEKQLNPSSSYATNSIHPRYTSRERKMALQQDVDKLKKKLRHEENVHRALERAFTRPLGALPRLPPYLPPNTLELLAEVAVLEEEVVWLEEQVVNFRQGLYQEAVYISSSKKSVDSTSDSCEQQNPPSQILNFDTTTTLPSHSHSDEQPNPPSHRRLSSCPPLNGKKNAKKNASTASFSDGKENLLSSNSAKKYRQMSMRKPTKNSASSGRKRHMESNASEKCSGSIQLDIRAIDQEKAESIPASGNGKVVSKRESPNKTSEDVLKCLMTIFYRISGTKAGVDSGMLPYAYALTSHEGEISMEFRDPYGMCAVLGGRDIGPYKNVQMIELGSIVADRIAGSALLVQRLKILLGRLASVDLRGLTHQQKLAFWINVYNSCMMNAYLEHGIPGSPQMVVALMPKATISVSGHLLNAMTIEHFILRFPYSKFTNPKGVRNDEATMRTIFALDWPEPLVTFALSCGSWSSPAVRVYSAVCVENELEMAKRDYLQASVAISSTKVAIPKLLHWYLLDFAVDVESLLDWICLQLPSEMRKEAIKCLERGKKEEISEWVHVIPYEFCFRYLLSPEATDSSS